MLFDNYKDNSPKHYDIDDKNYATLDEPKKGFLGLVHEIGEFVNVKC